MTLVPVAQGEEAAFLFDLYLHATLEDTRCPVFRVPGLDIRKFLHQSIVGDEVPRDIARLQAYFAEFARKAKIVYPLPGSAENRPHWSSYEDALLPLLRRDVEDLFAQEAAEAAADEPHRALLERLPSPRGEDLRVLDQYLRDLARKVEKTGALTGSAPEDLRSIAAAREQLLALSTAQKVADIVLINNCREPGNYEVILRDASGQRLLHGAFALPARVYDAILEAYHGLGVFEQGTGTRFSESLRALDEGQYGSSGPDAEAPRRFPRVRIRDVEAVLSPQAPGRRAPTSRGRLRVATGFIAYHEYETELQMKSGYDGNDDPLSFVRVDPRKPVPLGFTPPSGHSSAEYWSAANAGKAVPHTFLRFEDVQAYDVHLSGFDVNGVYLGRSDLEVFDRERQEGRWPFDYSYLRNLSRFELETTDDGLTAIRLLASRGRGRGVSFSFGNISLAIGESTEVLFGIGSQPLIAAYNDDPFQEPLSYAVAFGGDGLVLDHHESGVGVEQVYLERLDARSFRVRLVSHERILPVWEAVIGVEADASERQ